MPPTRGPKTYTAAEAVLASGWAIYKILEQQLIRGSFGRHSTGGGAKPVGWLPKLVQYLDAPSIPPKTR